MLRSIRLSIMQATTLINAINGIARAVNIIRENTDDTRVLEIVQGIADDYATLCEQSVIQGWERDAERSNGFKQEYQRTHGNLWAIYGALSRMEGVNRNMMNTVIMDEIKRNVTADSPYYDRLIMEYRERIDRDYPASLIPEPTKQALVTMLHSACGKLGTLTGVLRSIDDIIFKWGSIQGLSLTTSDIASLREEMKAEASKYFAADHS